MVTEQTADNLVVGEVETETIYEVLGTEDIVRGEALKLDAGVLKKIAATTDAVYGVATLAYTIGGADKKVPVYVSGKLLGSEIVFGAGALSDFRDGMKKDTQILVVEG